MKPSFTAKALLIGASPSELLGLGETVQVLEEFGVRHEELLLSDVAEAGVESHVVWVVGVAGNPGPALLLARKTRFPVIAVPLTETALYALNAAVTASRKNLPICMVAIGGAHNAGLLAVQMLGTERLLNQVRSHKQDLRRKVLAKKIR